MAVTTDFEDIAETLLENKRGLFLLTGPAGSGKSTFVQQLMSDVFENVVCVAPTGVAALNIGGQTIHSMFRLPLGPLLPHDSRLLNIKFRKNKILLLKKAQLIIVDEISMVRADVLDAIDLSLRNILRNDMPFGGKRVLLVGDPFQLEPVVKPEEGRILSNSYPSPFFFHAHSFSHIVIHFRLSRIYRQTDRRFIGILNQIKYGELDEYVFETLNSRVGKLDSDAIILGTTRALVENINQSKLSELAGSAKTYHGAVKGEFSPNIMPTDYQLLLKIGARVMFVKNDSELKVVNGTLGTILSMQESNVEVKLDDGRVVEVSSVEWENINYDFDLEKSEIIEKKLGSFMQLPLKIAWAVTIHKSQGLTFDKVHINTGTGAFAHGQLYVALSRCRTLEGITLEHSLKPSDFRLHQLVVQFDQGML